MRKDRIAEWLLDRVTTHERAASTVGDLRETAASRGGAWFWWSVTRTAVSLLWRGMVADPRAMLGLAFRAWLVSLCLAAVASFAGVFVAGMVFGVMAMRHSTGGLGAVSGGFGDAEMLPAVTASMMLCQFAVGRWIARRAPGREFAACLAFTILQWVLAWLVALVLTLVAHTLGSALNRIGSWWYLLTNLFCFLGALSVRRRASN
jgi:hypothetical protein